MRKAMRLHDRAKGNAPRQKTRRPVPTPHTPSLKKVWAHVSVKPERLKEYLHSTRTA